MLHFRCYHVCELALFQMNNHHSILTEDFSLNCALFQRSHLAAMEAAIQAKLWDCPRCKMSFAPASSQEQVGMQGCVHFCLLEFHRLGQQRTSTNTYKCLASVLPPLAKTSPLSRRPTKPQLRGISMCISLLYTQHKSQIQEREAPSQSESARLETHWPR